MVLLGVFQDAGPYLDIHYLAEGEKVENAYPQNIAHEGDIFEGYVPSTEDKRREIWEKAIQESLVTEFHLKEIEAESVLKEMKGMDIETACRYLEKEYNFYGANYTYEETAYHKGTKKEINSYIAKKLGENPFSFYFSRKFADFAGLYMGFFAMVMLSVLFLQDTRKNTYELLHTKPVSAEKYIIGKIGGGFVSCLMVLVILNLLFWMLCTIYTKNSGFELRFADFALATCLYILPNMLMIVSIYCLVSLLFKNPLPAVPLLFLYMVYSNMGSRNAEGIYGYYGRTLAIMVRFPGMFFDTAPPPKALFNQSFLIIASIGIIFISILLWKRRRVY